MNQILDTLASELSSISKKSTIYVGLSGGVDSSLSIVLLKELGYPVIGIFMKNWEEEGHCSAVDDYRDVARVCKSLEVPFYSVQFSKEYREEIFEGFLQDLKNGLTPNPDILCNREIKFKRLLQKALSIGGDYLATGHYAKNVFKDGYYQLEKAHDQTKDQTYFLYTATQESLSKTIFPLASLQKTEVRKLAKQYKVPVAEKKDSTGICFIGERNFKEFIKNYLGYTEGPMVTVEGKYIKDHDGLAYYTIGQRKGLGIGGDGEAWFVVDKNVEENTLIVAQGVHHPALFADELSGTDAHWIGKKPTFPLHCTAKIRYRQKDQACVVEEKDGLLLVCFREPQRAITPKQSIVFYDGDVCLGGAFIKGRGLSYYDQSQA
jgi:tRNA-uridine 2-sulfurtransferase